MLRVRRASACLSLCALGLATLAAREDPPRPDDAWQVQLFEPPAPVDAHIAGPLPAAERLSCAGCHAAIAAEWSQSLHAHAWVDPRYRAELETKRRPAACHGCHVPEPLHLAETLGSKPAPRGEDAERRELGISCRSCHQGPDGTILGPFGAPTDAHRSVRSERFVGTGSNALCITCHATTIGPVIGIAKDFVQARLEERGMSCVGCHMAPLVRPIATDDEDHPGQPRAGRSHRLQTPRDPRFLAQAFALEARAQEGATVLSIANRAGHRVPGLTSRRITFRATALSEGGETLAEAETVVDGREVLPVLGSRELWLDGAAARVRVEAIHQAPHLEEPLRFVDVELAVEGR